VIVYIVQICMMLVLSVGSNLSVNAMLFGAGLILAILFKLSPEGNRKEYLEFHELSMSLNKSSMDAAIFTSICVIFCALAYRSFYFFDTTWDGLTYELPRISFYASYKTLLVNQSTQMINIFSNEWNGELNGLFYVVCTGNDQASSFGNVDIWLFAFIAYSWMASVLGVPRQWRFLVGFVISLLPILLSLAMTVKGDLLAIVGLPLAVCWFRKSMETEEIKFSTTMLFMSIGLAGGSKITVMPVCIIILGYYTLTLFRKRVFDSKQLYFMVAGILGLGIGFSRYLINMLVYGNPFQRIAGESARFALGNYYDSMIGMFSNIVGSLNNPFVFPSESWALNKGLGYVGIIILFAPIILFFDLLTGKGKKKRWNEHIQAYFIALALTFGLLLLSFTTPWYSWSFRYYMPVVMCLIVYILGRVFVYASKDIVRLLLVISLLFISIIHLDRAFQVGEVLPSSFLVAQARSQQERKLALHPYLYDTFGLNTIPSLISRGGEHVLILNGMTTPIVPFFGPNHSNHVELCSGSEELVNNAKSKYYDWIVITGPNKQMYAESDILKLGYCKCLSNEWWAIFSKNKGS